MEENVKPVMANYFYTVEEGFDRDRHKSMVDKTMKKEVKNEIPLSSTVTPHGTKRKNSVLDENVTDYNTMTSCAPVRLMTKENTNMSLCHCSDPDGCVNLQYILQRLNVPLSEEQAFALIHQSIHLFRDALYAVLDTLPQENQLTDRCLRLPTNLHNLNVHRDGSVHVSFDSDDSKMKLACSEQKIMDQLGLLVYQALDYQTPDNDECTISDEMEFIIKLMTDENISMDEGIEQDAGDSLEKTQGEMVNFDQILEICAQRIVPAVPNEHYRAVCRALATETLELRTFLQKIGRGDTEKLHASAKIETPHRELQQLAYADWTRYWGEVMEDLRRGVRLKKCNYERPSIEFKLTPYEILMDDIRTRNYKLRRVMMTEGRVKLDAHAMILEFIRSRPTLKKASDRLIVPRQRTPTPHERLLDSIRKGRQLRHIQPKFKSRLESSTLVDNSQAVGMRKGQETIKPKKTLPQLKQRLIRVDSELWNNLSQNAEPKAPPKQSTFLQNSFKFVRQLFRTQSTNKVKTSVEAANTYKASPTSRRLRRRSNSLIPLNKDSINKVQTRMATPVCSSISVSTSPVNSLVHTQDENGFLTLNWEEFAHIRSVQTKALLENLDHVLEIKANVEKRKICFLCLTTRFTTSIHGIECELCNRTVCSKCSFKSCIRAKKIENIPIAFLSPQAHDKHDDIQQQQWPSMAMRINDIMYPTSRNNAHHSPNSTPKSSRSNKENKWQTRNGRLTTICNDCHLVVAASSEYTR